MATQQANPSSAWFDGAKHTSLIAEKAQRTESFLSAMAGGRIDPAEVAAQENRLVALMAEIEPQLSPALHAKVTDLLCELTVYDFMQAMVSLEKSRPKTAFRG
jgi:3-methyladenine DNA glycosylase Tag